MWNIIQKVARQQNTFKADNFVDIIGYSATVDQMNRHMQELGYNGITDFEAGMTLNDLHLLLEDIRRGHK